MKTQITSLVVVLLLSLTGTNCTKKASQTASVSSSTNPTPATAGTTTHSSSGTPSGNATSAPSTEEYTGYVGRYKMDSDRVGHLNVVWENNKLYGYADDQPKTEIKYESKDRFNFQTPNMSGTVTFTRDSQQQVSGMVVMVNGNELRGEKVKQ